MARAGWCRECGEWVWVDEEGSCQYGHDEECVERIHEQPEGGPVDRPFGVGDLPPELTRFNWGAFFMPLFWGLAYGSWQVVWVWLLALTSPLVVASFSGSGQSTPATTIIALTVLGEIVYGVARLWVGLNANRTLWKKEALRLQTLELAKPRFTVGRFSKRQKTWTIWASVLVGVSLILGMPLQAQMWKPYELTVVGAVMPIVWILVEVGAGLWLDRRREDPEAERPEAPIV